MDLSIKTEAFQQDDQSWLGSAHGTESTRTITLDVSKFTAGTHYPNGYIPSGTALGLITASSKYGPYDDTQTDGRQTLVGHLFTGVKVPASTSTPVGAALYEHGRVRTAKLPFSSGAGAVDANGKADVKGQIIYV
ncbi:head decoration protein [Amycolatopsis sp. VS8301801F10]|uniref:head decoration protein n=1 Tax=unclassified Amycolatopsis TaxID=2618356 RepID=UPI0038FD3F01